ncbi:SAM-dependent methyltransferase [Micromonospora siamensis]|uniref:S-adenosyl methyltransferase n=1 Tax=Micromonospora siamensis TaxID=299152 RepID=A0A1C5HXH7_9ACTN|nr:SAM-dependent methyltransferase [Micromonospora siamensis]SCG50785.1 S-adenosyl methyltransferase [Micromonospora siamensis]
MTAPSTPDAHAGRGADRIDTTVVHPARRYNYWLGGKDNFAVDRESGDRIAAVYPGIRTLARENRAFLGRAVRFLAEETGIRQFLDIGTGIPSADNTHEVAQSVAPESRVVYVDNDPMVLVHARALLTSAPDGATAYLDADLREPERILADPQLHATLDLTRPVALVLVAVAHFLTDEDRPHEKVATLLDALPSGSWLVLTHFTTDHIPPAIVERMYAEFASGRMKQDTVPRTGPEFARFFTGLELADPGIVPVTEWRPQVPADQRPALAEASIYGAVARKP